ncbi:MAG TPA: hypothetical protein VGM96_31355 [Reyranella sp.]
MNTHIRVFLTIVSLIFAGLLAIQFVATLLHPADRPNPTAERQRVVDRPADPAPTVDPPRTPSGRGLIRRAKWIAKAG